MEEKKRENRNRINILRDPELIAEIESIQPGLIWLILSGGLSIGGRIAKRWETQMKIYGKIMGDLKNNKKGKIFLLNFCRLILNDATPSKDEDSCIDIWNNLYDRIAGLMIDDEDDNSQDEDIFRDQSSGKMKYNVSGERNLYKSY